MRERLFRFRYLAIFVGVFYLIAFGYHQRWENRIINGGDGWGYYAYLPATFLHGDLQNIDSTYLLRFNYGRGKPHYPGAGGELPQAENGHRIIKYTCGVAILQLPFFALGHSWALLDGRYETDGFSLPYIFMVLLGTLFYLLLGAYLLYRFLASNFNPKTAFWTLLILALGTNLFNFAVYRADMSHAYLATLYAVLIYGSWQFYRSPTWRWTLLIGFSAGFITLIRPVEMLCLAIPFFYGFTNREAIEERFQMWQLHWPKLFGAAAVFIICGIPQLLYWKYATGHWFFDSYPGESFDFINPSLYEGLFSFQNGWLVYSPVMAIALLGMLFLLKHRNWLWPVIIIVPAHIYIAYSWWCWNYINGFGSRPMVDIYPLLSIPLAYVVWWSAKAKWSSFLLALLTFLAIGLQLFQNWQHSKGILWSEMANKAYYWSVFGQTSMSYDALVAFETQQLQPDSTQLEKATTLFASSFEIQDSSINRVGETAWDGDYSLLLNPDKKYFNLYAGSAVAANLKTGQWLRVSTWGYKKEIEQPWYAASSIVFDFSREGKNYYYNQLRIDNKLGNPGYSIWGGEENSWGWLGCWIPIPENIQANDLVKIYLMTENEPVYLDETKLEVWKPK